MFLIVACGCISLDQFGITKLYTSTNNGLDFVPNWNNTDRTVYAVAVDPNSTNQSCYARGGSAYFVINATTNIMSMHGNSPRYYCYLNHTNVEVTAYAKRGNETKTLSTQGLVIVARSRHKDYDINYCNAQSYYFRLYNNGKACFLKEFIHSEDCLIYGSGNPCINDFTGDELGVIPGRWYGMKLIIQNIGDIVNLKGYVDFEDGTNGGNWQLILEYNDTDQWLADVEEGEEYCMSNCSYDGSENWKGESTSVFLRASYIEDYQWKYFSVREIEPMQMYLPTKSPTLQPSVDPTSFPSEIPSAVPTIAPSDEPSWIPTGDPTLNPSKEPSAHPTQTPSDEPSLIPSDDVSSMEPTLSPSVDPAQNPSADPTDAPYISPSTEQPSVVIVVQNTTIQTKSPEDVAGNRAALCSICVTQQFLSLVAVFLNF